MINKIRWVSSLTSQSQDRCPRGNSLETEWLDRSVFQALQLLTNTPRSLVEDRTVDSLAGDLDNYVAPQPPRVESIRVQVRVVGLAKPMPYYEDFELP